MWWPQPVASPKDHQSPGYYETNGTGRDTYISYNNGGFAPGQYKLMTHQFQESKQNILRRQLQSLPQRVNYISDGSGRDTYVIKCVPDKFIFSPEFPTQLRTYGDVVFSPRYQKKLPPLLIEKSKRLKNKQDKLILRLSKPKLNTEDSIILKSPKLK